MPRLNLCYRPIIKVFNQGLYKNKERTAQAGAFELPFGSHFLQQGLSHGFHNTITIENYIHE